MSSEICLTGFGSFVPEKILDNATLSTMVATSDEWITSRTGIKTRHIVSKPEENVPFLATKASEDLFHKAHIAPSSITHILCATCTAATPSPSVSCVFSAKLGIHGAMAFDLNAACSGYLYGLEIARAILSAAPAAQVLLVASEAITTRVNWKDRSTCVLFGDGAGACLLTTKGHAPKLPATAVQARLIEVTSFADGTYPDLVAIGGGSTGKPYTFGDTVGSEYFLTMDGQELFKQAVRAMVKACTDLLAKHDLNFDAIDLLIPHQANLRIIEAVGKRLNLPASKVFINVQKYGNTSAASIPLALADAHNSGRILPGMKVLLTTFGGGLTWSAALLEF